MTTFKDHTGTEHDFAALPEATRQAIVNRGISHLFGNECASVVVGQIRKHLANGGKASDVTGDAIRKFRDDPANESVLDDWLASARNAKVAAMLQGTLGVRVAGATIDPLEAMIRRLAKAELIARIGSKNFPRKDGDVYVGAGGVRYEGEAGGEAMVDKYLEGVDTKGAYGKAGEPNFPRFERMAKRELEAKAKAKRAAVEAGDESPV